MASHFLRMAPSCLAATASFNAPSTAAMAEPSSNLSTRSGVWHLRAQISGIVGVTRWGVGWFVLT